MKKQAMRSLPMHRKPATLNTGQCGLCRHRKQITSARGSQFVLCQRALTNSQFAKYPHLPVTDCAGFEALDRLNLPSTTKQRPKADR